ncbi:NLR family CARD domain-containing protein 3 [Sphaeramia orbicularis]|uniref:NLR family CARD domain-containing protein 3-like n=1 Tax=Sphaeramia orbicularis TaxID=375764 RepID=A0A673BWU0_9TELE|nr:NLR family CARD domain-containing protein 3-like [Sphaeramia orbicularis]
MDDSELFEDMATPSGSSDGDAPASGGSEYPEDEEDDGLYYIPPRRPSLDLGPDPMDTSEWHYVDQALSPALSYHSMSSDYIECSAEMADENGFSTSVHLERLDSYSSSYSLDSDDCEKRTQKVQDKDDTASETFILPELIEDFSEPVHPSLTVAFVFKAICKVLGRLKDLEFKRFKKILWQRYPQTFNTPFESMDMVDVVDRVLECYSLRVSIQIVRCALVDIEVYRMVDFLDTLCIHNEVRHDLCQTLKEKYNTVCIDLNPEGEKRPLDDVYTNLYMTRENNNGPNIEHEVLTIGKLSTNNEGETRMSPGEIFDEEWVKDNYVSIALINGAAGSGKSMAVRRLILDWAEGKSHEHVTFLFPLFVRDLKKYEDSEISLVEIIETLYPETKKLRTSDYTSSESVMVIVIDGLDEHSGKLDFENTEIMTDLETPKNLNVILVNIIRGRLLYHSRVLLTSRPQMRPVIPWDTHHMVFEVRGFCDPEKDEYFKKKIKDPSQAAQVIEYVNSSKTLRIMCHLPLFCSLVAEECLRIKTERGPQAELPTSLTYMYTKLMLLLMRQLRRFRAPDLPPNEELEFIMSLGKLAFNLLEKGKFRITKISWKDCKGIDKEAITRTGLCYQFLISLHVLYHEVAVSFIHATMQEYLASLYVFLSFRNQGKNIFEQQQKGKLSRMLRSKNMEVFKSAVERSLLCEDGKLDFFLRFLCGMANKKNMELLQTFFIPSAKWTSVIEETDAHIRKRIAENQFPARNDNLKHCLVELGVQQAASI